MFFLRKNMENLEDFKYRRYLKLRHFIREFSNKILKEFYSIIWPSGKNLKVPPSRVPSRAPSRIALTGRREGSRACLQAEVTGSRKVFKFFPKRPSHGSTRTRLSHKTHKFPSRVVGIFILPVREARRVRNP